MNSAFFQGNKKILAHEIGHSLGSSHLLLSNSNSLNQVCGTHLLESQNPLAASKFFHIIVKYFYYYYVVIVIINLSFLMVIVSVVSIVFVLFCEFLSLLLFTFSV